MLRLTTAVSRLATLRRAPAFAFSRELKTAEKQLAQSISTELSYEEGEADAESADFEQRFLANNAWQLHASEESARLELRRQLDRTTVRVLYSARMPEEEPEAPEGEQAEEMPEPEYDDFTVVVDNHNNADKLVLQLVAFNGQIEVQSAFTTPDAESFAANKAALFTTDRYTGPAFDSLDERLQDAVLAYLKSLGVDEDLAVFVSSSAAAHEQKLYKKWLADFKHFLA